MGRPKPPLLLGPSSREIQALCVHIRQVAGVALVQPRPELVILFVHLDHGRLYLAAVIPSLVQRFSQQQNRGVLGGSH